MLSHKCKAECRCVVSVADLLLAAVIEICNCVQLRLHCGASWNVFDPFYCTSLMQRNPPDNPMQRPALYPLKFDTYIAGARPYLIIKEALTICIF